MTMLWSPRKHAGYKRPLEVENAESSEEEEELGSEGTETETGYVRLLSVATAGQTRDQEIEELRGNEEEEIGRGAAAANLQTAHMEEIGPGKRLGLGARTQARDWPDKQHRRIGSGDEGEQDPRSAQQEEEEEPIGSNKGRIRPRKSKGKERKENRERREGATEGENTEGPEDEPAERQGQAAPQNRGSQQLTQGPQTQSEADGALLVVDGGNGHQISKKADREKDFIEGPNETVLVRWSNETANTSPYMEVNIWGKQTWEVEPP